MAAAVPVVMVSEWYAIAWVFEREAAHERWEAWMAAVSANTLQAYRRFLQENPSTLASAAPRPLEDVAKRLLQHQRDAISAEGERSSGTRCRLFLVYHRERELLRPRGFVNAAGSLVIGDLRFDEVRAFSEGLAAVKRDNVWGFMDSAGHLTVPPQFDTVRDLSDDRAAVYSMQRCGYIDGRGAMVIPARFHECSSFRDGRALVHRDNPDPPPKDFRTALVDSSGRILADLGSWVHWEVDPPFSEGMAPVRVESSYYWVPSRTRFMLSMYVSDKGAFTYGNTYHTAQRFSEGLAAVQSSSIRSSDPYPLARTYKPYYSNWGYIDKRLKMIIPTTYDSAEPFREGLAKVRTKGGDGFIDHTGRLVIQTGQAGTFSEGLAEARFGSGWGYIDRQGLPVIPGLFESTGPFCGGVARVAISKKFAGLIDRSGRLIWVDTWTKSRWEQFWERITPTWWPTYTDLHVRE